MTVYNIRNSIVIACILTLCNLAATFTTLQAVYRLERVAEHVSQVK